VSIGASPYQTLLTLHSNKAVVGAAVGGSIAGVAIVGIALLLLSRARSRRKSHPDPLGPSHPSMVAGPLQSPHTAAPFMPPTAMPPTIMAPMATRVSHPMIVPADDLPSIGTAGSFGPTAPLLAAPQNTLQQTQGQDYDPYAFASPPASARSLSPSIPRSSQYLTDDQVDFVAGLYRARIPPTDVARIVESMVREGEPSASGASSGTGVAAGGQAAAASPAAPPAYDFKTSLG
jgi:hypothetical protein